MVFGSVILNLLAPPKSAIFVVYILLNFLTIVINAHRDHEHGFKFAPGDPRNFYSNHRAPGGLQHYRYNMPGGHETILHKELRLQISPAGPIHVDEGREAVLQCKVDGDPSARIIWTRLGGPLPQSARDHQNGILIISRIRPEDQGSYICTATTSQSKEVVVELLVDHPEHDPNELVAPRPNNICGSEEATCRNGECIRRQDLCDNKFDCRDKSDELYCDRRSSQSDQTCQPTEFRCANRLCVQKMWVCDGEDDCGDRSDERSCGSKGPGDVCAPWEFECRSGRQCVPKNYHCDGQKDCVDMSDEIGCVGPTVVEPPEKQLSVCERGEIVLKCRATGVPIPYISWRLNWGHVCEPPRCTQESVNGLGTLTIRNANSLDQGAYSCEAINTKGRVLYNPDAIVTVNNCDLTKCHRDGTLNSDRGQCVCKAHVSGPSCDRCEENAFHFPDQYNTGCIRCFCMGITRQCQESKYYRTQERINFAYDDQGVILSDSTDRLFENVRGDWSKISGYLTIDNPRSSSVLYWKLPARFNGNKLTSYGGKMKFLIQFESCSSPNSDPLVIIKGNDITLVHKGPNNMAPGRANEIVIDMIESSWSREDGQEATREHFLMTLAEIDSFLIRFSHCSGQSSSSLGDVVLDIAVPTDTQQVQAKAVEQCFCPEGYQGLSCEQCAPGFERSGGGLYLGTCTRKPDSGCDPLGSLAPKPGAYGRCVCKEYVQGPQCNDCKPHSFFLNPANPHGCLPCFCSGVTKDCDSSNYFVTQEKFSYDDSHPADIVLKTSDSEQPHISEHRPLLDGNRHLSIDNFDGVPQGKPLYLQLPGQFLGNKITSYGGALTIKFQCTGSGEEKRPFLIIRGNDISLQYKLREPIQSEQDTTVVAKLYENEWFREDGHEATREHFLMTLADLNTLLIRVSCFETTEKFSLIDLTMDFAVAQPVSSVQAKSVEQCRCPQGYVGTSCEDCASGFTRTGGGLYLGLCERCQCHGHADSCDPEYGDCIDCKHNTHGPRCNLCKPGFVGDATQGRPDDCLPESEACTRCECHNHSPRGCDRDCRCIRCEHNTEGANCESCKRGFYGDARQGTPHDCRPCPCPECYLDRNQQVVCVPCPTGYAGPTCTDCAEGYSMDPYDRRCKPIDANVRVEPDRQEVEEGAATSFHCTSSNPQVRLSWYGPENGLPPGSYEAQGQLVLYNIRPTDAGNYRCVGIFPDGRSATGYGHLTVKPRGEPFRVQIEEPKHAEIEEGNPHTMRCVAVGNYREPVRFTWSKVSQHSLPRNAQHREGDLHFYEVNRESEGHYQCVGVTSDGQTAQDDGSLRVRPATRPAPEPFRVRIQEPKKITPEEGDPASFQCLAENKQEMNPRFTWTRLDGQIPEEAVQDSGLLTIHNASPEDDGVYRCTGHIDETGETAHDDGTLEMTPAPTEPFVVAIDEPKSKEAFENGMVKFNCKVVSRVTKGEPKLTWTREDNAPFDEHVSVTDGQISFGPLKKEHSGSYVCTGTVSDSKLTSSDKAQLNVKPYDGLAPLIKIEPSLQTVKLGDPIKITCTSSGSPPPVLHWSQKSPQGSLPDTAEQDDGVLTIPHARNTDGGQYFCSASNDHGQVVESAMVDLESGSVPPKVQVVPKSKRLKPGENFAFTCKVLEGSPTPQLSWISGDSATLDNNVQKSGADNQRSLNLQITDAREDNSGKYTCIGSNDLGEHRDTAELTVTKGDLVVKIIPGGYNGSIDIPYSDPLKLECVAEVGPGLPEPTVQWLHDEGPSRGDLPDGYKPVQIDGRFITHDAVTEINKGVYTCRGRSGNLTKEVSINVNIPPRQKRDVIIMGASERAVPDGGSLILRCVLNNDGRPNPLLRWVGPNGQPNLPPNAHVEEAGVLRIEPFSNDHAGTYECQHTNVDGEVVGKSSVKVALAAQSGSGATGADNEIPPLTVTVDGGAVRTLEVNEALELKCTGHAPHGETSELKWYHHGKTGGDRAARGVVRDGVLTINNIKPYDAGIYTCVQYLDGRRDGDYQVTVLVSQIGTDAVKRRFAVGEFADIECPVYSVTGMTYSWLKVDGEFSNTVSPNDHFLTVTGFQSNDAGVYECEAVLGAETAIGYVELVNRDPNSVQVYMVVEPEYVTLGTDVRFECVVEGDESARIDWSRSDGPLPSRAKVEGKVMIIENIRREETGVYTCTAHTKAGVMSSVAGLPLGGKVTTNLVRRYFRARRRFHHAV